MNILLYHTDQNKEFSYGWVYETNKCDEVIGLPGITYIWWPLCHYLEDV